MLQLLKIKHTLLAGKVKHVFTQFPTLKWFFISKALYGRSFSFAVLLSAYHLTIKRVSERDVDFDQLLQAFITPSIGLYELLRHMASSTKPKTSGRLDPEQLYARVPPTFVGFVLSFDGSAKIEKHGGFSS